MDQQSIINDLNKKQAEQLSLTVGKMITEQPKNTDFTICTKHDHLSGKGIYAISKPVKSWRQVKDTALKFANWLNTNNGKFDGIYKLAYAISHCQVCDEPYKMFVVHRQLVRPYWFHRINTKTENNKNFYFPSQIILNAEILETPFKVKAQIPKRESVTENGKPGYKIVTKEGEVNNIISVPDACMSFPERKQKQVNIYFKIKVRYQYKGIFGFLRTKTEWVEGLKAHIFQHEVDHQNALNIYYKHKDVKRNK